MFMSRMKPWVSLSSLTFALASAAPAGAESISPSIVTRPSTPVPLVTVPYNGGYVVTAPVHIYVIWYGDWSASSTTSGVLSTFLDYSSSTLDPWLNMLSTYKNASGVSAATSATFAGQTTVVATGSVTLGSEGALTSVITNAISSGGLPSDPAGFYFVLGGPNVTYNDGTNGFFGAGKGCVNFCGFHNWGTFGSPAPPTPSSRTRTTAPTITSRLAVRSGSRQARGPRRRTETSPATR